MKVMHVVLLGVSVGQSEKAFSSARSTCFLLASKYN